MKILLIDVDSRIANLSLMKISAFYKKQGAEVELNNELCNPDKVFISKIFTSSKITYPGPATIGGSGYDLKTVLPEDIEHLKPDYSLYNSDYSMGFTTRGCIRKCNFCLEPNTEILMADLSTKKLKDICIGDSVIGIKESKKGELRHFISDSIVIGKTKRNEIAYRILLENGIEVICSGNHRWLTASRGWKYTTGKMTGLDQRPYLTLNNRIKFLGSFNKFKETKNFKKGYISGMFHGDGYIGFRKEKRIGFQDGQVFRLALTDIDALKRTKEYLEYFRLRNLH